jgi:hypothetical protein
MKGNQMSQSQKPWSLIGCGVHKYERKNGRLYVANQGVVVIEKDGLILIEWFDWILGDPLYATWHELIACADEPEWRFFENVEHMNGYYEAHKSTIEEPIGDS